MSTINLRALLSHIAEQLTSATDPDDLGIRADQLVEQIGAALDQSPATEADFRALCAELLSALAEYDDANPYRDCHDLIRRAETALDQQP